MSDGELANFLAHSLELESEAEERYRELAQALTLHHNVPVAQFFNRMADESANHLAEIEEITEGMQLPTIPPWDFEWSEPEAPESASFEAVHYRMSLREAMQLALENERGAARFYSGFAERSSDPETAALARRFAAEEGKHEAALLDMLLDLPAEPRHRRVEDDDPTVPE